MSLLYRVCVLILCVKGREIFWSQRETDPSLKDLFASLNDHDKVYIPKGTYTSEGGLELRNLHNISLNLEGRLSFSPLKGWPREKNGHVKNALIVENVTHFHLWGSGTIDGKGQHWWGLPGIGYLQHAENRPRLVQILHSQKIRLQGLTLINSPYWTLDIKHCDMVEVDHVTISNVRSMSKTPTLWDMTAFNTDGIDVAGSNIWIHDVSINTQDDTIAIKGPSSNILVERVHGTGMGLAIGAIADETYRNITVRDSWLEYPYKGIYIKFQPIESKFDVGEHPNPNGTLSDVLFENITLVRPLWWALWIGPAQQSDTRSLCYANPCSICYPLLPTAHCNGQPERYAQRVTLRHVRIVQPRGNLGLIMGAHPPATFTSIIFDSVRVVNEAESPRPESLLPLAESSTPDPYLGGTFSILFLIALLLCFSCLKWTLMGYAIACGIFTSGALMSVFAFLHLMNLKGDTYTRCEGVENGIAMGDTWPLPDCFEDQTTGEKGTYNYTPMSYGGVALGLLVSSLVIFVITCFRRTWGRRRGTPTNYIPLETMS